MRRWLAAVVLIGGPLQASPQSKIEWTKVDATRDCFFFSGPDGRDDKLVGEVHVEAIDRGAEGARVSLRIGTALFNGSYIDGQLSVSRSSQHDFGGPWAVTEHVNGTLRDGRIHASYSYQECDRRTHACPGRCKINRTLEFTVSPASSK